MWIRKVIKVDKLSQFHRHLLSFSGGKITEGKLPGGNHRGRLPGKFTGGNRRGKARGGDYRGNSPKGKAPVEITCFRFLELPPKRSRCMNQLIHRRFTSHCYCTVRL